jgi:hypothetical protein
MFGLIFLVKYGYKNVSGECLTRTNSRRAEIEQLFAFVATLY